ncbi:carboxylate-amine ligase [Kitasatospora camelliae]|uniref:Putative glutamate--cysteine ligase 2 n=1 Tax=Kitasatospora camelliae TaxID=3156397 RepID=A0AAU8JPJ5_9ACTN
MTAGPGRGPLRFGIEEEFLLVDPATFRTVPLAKRVLAEARPTLGRRAQTEFIATQVEACTRPVATVDELRSELAATRGILAAAAASAGCLLVASGTPVLPSAHPLPVTDAPRYREVAAHVGAVADQPGGELCGCHVHLGELTRAEALALGVRLRPWLPVLEAMCVNSPFCEGRDRGLASTRAGCYAAWPTCGPAPVLDEPGYERTVRRLLSERVILDRKMIYWYARPSEHVPTLEIRIADTNADREVIVLLAVLLRGLARVPRASAPPPPVPAPAEVARAHRLAARSGLSGPGLDLRTGVLRPMRELLSDLLVHASPGLERTGDLALAQTLVRRLLAGGTGADRQRADFARRGSFRDVVAGLAATTARSQSRLAPAPTAPA